MKKFITLVTSIFLVLSFCIFASADNKYESITVEGFGDVSGFINPPVSDADGYLSSDTFNEATDLLSRIREQHSVDIVFYIEDEMHSYSVQASADDIYDYNGYGYNAIDGILLYICMDSREFAYTTYGSARYIFDEYVLEQIDYAITPYLSSNDFDEAVTAYAEKCEFYLENYANGDTDYYENLEEYLYPVFDNNGDYYYSGSSNSLPDVFYIVLNYAAVAVIAAVIALIITASKAKKMKTAVAKNEADNYIKSGSMSLKYSNDIFLYANVTKTPIPKQTKSGPGGGRSGGGMHTSSSGRSHGGRSGRF